MFVWDLDGIRIFEKMTVCGIVEDFAIAGVLLKRGEPLEWQAKVTPRGWFVMLRGETGRVSSYTGTFDMCAAIHRVALIHL